MKENAIKGSIFWGHPLTQHDQLLDETLIKLKFSNGNILYLRSQMTRDYQLWEYDSMTVFANHLTTPLVILLQLCVLDASVLTHSHTLMLIKRVSWCVLVCSHTVDSKRLTNKKLTSEIIHILAMSCVGPHIRLHTSSKNLHWMQDGLFFSKKS